MKPNIKHIAYVPKTKEDLEFIYNKMNQYFPTPYPSIISFIDKYESCLNVSPLVATSYMKRPLEIRWSLPENKSKRLPDVETFYEQFIESKLTELL